MTLVMVKLAYFIAIVAAGGGVSCKNGPALVVTNPPADYVEFFCPAGGVNVNGALLDMGKFESDDGALVSIQDHVYNVTMKQP